MMQPAIMEDTGKWGDEGMLLIWLNTERWSNIRAHAREMNKDQNISLRSVKFEIKCERESDLTVQSDGRVMIHVLHLTSSIFI